jgi:hypothetical protein
MPERDHSAGEPDVAEPLVRPKLAPGAEAIVRERLTDEPYAADTTTRDGRPDGRCDRHLRQRLTSLSSPTL